MFWNNKCLVWMALAVLSGLDYTIRVMLRVMLFLPLQIYRAVRYGDYGELRCPYCKRRSILTYKYYRVYRRVKFLYGDFPFQCHHCNGYFGLNDTIIMGYFERHLPYYLKTSALAEKVKKAQATIPLDAQKKEGE